MRLRRVASLPLLRHKDSPMKRTATASHPLTPRPLFRSLLLALASLPAGVVLAGDLDGQTAEVGAGDPVEAWTLKNGSLLTVNGGAAQTILADDSRVTLVASTVSRKPSGDYSEHAVKLDGNSLLDARDSTFVGNLRVHDQAQVTLSGSHVVVSPGAGQQPGDRQSVGLGFSGMSVGSGRILLDAR